MNRLAIVSAAALIALPAIASQQADSKAPSQSVPATTQATAAQPATPPDATAAPGTPSVQLTPAATTAVEDSPLVAAAKRAGGPNKKKSKIVITNENLRGQNAKVTTTASQAPLNVPPPADSQQSLTQLAGSLGEIQAKKDAADAQKKAAEAEAARTKRMEALRARADDDSLVIETDPAQLEHAQEQTSTQGQPPPPAPKKP